MPLNLSKLCRVGALKIERDLRLEVVARARWLGNTKRRKRRFFAVSEKTEQLWKK